MATRGRKSDGKVTVSARISADAYEKLAEYRWENRIDTERDLFSAIIEKFAATLDVPKSN